MSEKSNIVEKIILFAVFVVFAIIIVSFAFNMERIDVKEPQSDGSFQYVTSSKPEYKSSYDEQVSNLPSDGGGWEGKSEYRNGRAAYLTARNRREKG